MYNMPVSYSKTGETNPTNAQTNSQTRSPKGGLGGAGRRMVRCTVYPALRRGYVFTLRPVEYLVLQCRLYPSRDTAVSWIVMWCVARAGWYTCPLSHSYLICVVASLTLLSPLSPPLHLNLFHFFISKLCQIITVNRKYQGRGITVNMQMLCPILHFIS